jgi:peptide/nickel transport system permease protein
MSYVLRRLLQAIVTAIGVTVLVFFMLHMVPGDPARALLGPRATPELIEQLHHRWGLDRPLLSQYGLFMGRLLTGDLGDSFFFQLPVTRLIVERLPATLLLLLMSTVFTLLITVPLATIAAVNRGRLVDSGIRTLPIVGLGMPAVWIGIMLILIFSLRLRWFPVGGFGDTPLEHLRSLVLPAFTVALGISPMTTRSLRASMISVLDADFITTARAKGVPARRILAVHALRNSVLPMITVLAVNIGFLVGGSVVIEQVFALPGVGGLMFTAILNRDFAVVQGVTLLFAILVILVSVLTDVAYAVIDPRVRFA